MCDLQEQLAKLPSLLLTLQTVKTHKELAGVRWLGRCFK